MNIKNVFIGLAISFALIGCSGGVNDGCGGWWSRDNITTGLVKKVTLDTGIFCPDYYRAEISLSLIHGNFGDLSTKDLDIYIPNDLVLDMKKAVKDSAIINFTYDERRAINCVDHYRMTSFNRIP